MNNFFKYPSGSDIDVAEMFTKDNLVSITGLRPLKSGFEELAVLNKDNNFSNEGQPTEAPEYLEIKFGNIAIGISTTGGITIRTFINRNIRIEIEKTRDDNSNTKYDLYLVNMEEGNTERIGVYYYN